MEHLEPTRVREQGTKVTLSKTPEEKIAAIRAIVTAGQYAKVNGIMVDLFSASAIISVYDAVNDENKARYAKLSIHSMAKLAFKLCK
jgi:hypothetical protein